MKQKRKLLIATTNKGKFDEIVHFLGDLPFKLLSLHDLPKKIKPPAETENTIEGNAIIKARYYGDKTGLLTIVDDTGLFVDALDGWPGVHSANIAPTTKEGLELLLSKLKNKKNRGATFRNLCIAYDPNEHVFFSAYGEVRGTILEKPITGKRLILPWGYNPVFYVPEAKNTYAEMTLQEKNAFGHRGRALIKIKYFLQRQYGAEHVVVPLGVIIKDGKILMALRNDPFRPEFHKRWEFPGGRMEIGETLEDNLKREILEETGYKVEVVKRFDYIKVNWREEYNFQVYLLPHICRIVGGKGKYRDAEILDMKFFELDEVLKLPLVGSDPEIFAAVMPELNEVIKQQQL